MRTLFGDGGSSVEPRNKSGNDPGCRASERQHGNQFVVVSLFRAFSLLL